jgi:hypothetical protein
MKYPVYILLFVSLISPLALSAQTLAIDPTLTFMVGGAAGMEKSSMNKLIKKQNIIEKAQTLTVATVNQINRVQDKLYKGLTYVDNTVRNIWQVTACAEVLADAVKYESKMLKEAKRNPAALAFAMKTQKELFKRGTTLYSSINQFILKANDKEILMDAGERVRLLNGVLQDLEVIRALAYSSYITVRMIIMEGILNHINPFKYYGYSDAQIVSSIMRNWKF